MGVTRFPVIGGEIPLTTVVGTESHASCWDLSNVCCVDQLRYLTASGEMVMQENEPGQFGWINLAPITMFDLADGSRTYLLVSPYIGWSAGVFALAVIGAIAASPPGYATVSVSAEVLTAGLDVPVIGPGPDTVPDRYTMSMWWDSVSPHDVQMVVSVGDSGGMSPPLGYTLTGAEPFLLNGNPGPLPDAMFGGFADGGFVQAETVTVGSVQSWRSGCAAIFPGTWDEVPFQGEVPCVIENFQDGFEGDAGQVASPPYLNPSVVAV